MDKQDAFTDDARIFSVDGRGWYFYAREGVVGPVTSYDRALRYLEKLKEFSEEQRNDVWALDARKQHRVERLVGGGHGPRRLTKAELREVVGYLERKVAERNDSLDVDQIRLHYCRKLLYRMDE